MANDARDERRGQPSQPGAGTDDLSWLRLMDGPLAPPPQASPEQIVQWWEDLTDEQRLAVFSVLEADTREELMQTIITVRGGRDRSDR